MAANKNKYQVELEGDISGLKNSVKEAQVILGQFGKNMETMFGILGIGITAAFSVQALSQFSQEAVKLAGEAEGIREAFNRINDANLDKLKASVQGTVSEVQLMKAAVKANNFKIPIEQLGTFFEFATKRAAQTGESVDYLVESIILGIGRKSPLILDNLGISAVELRAKFKGISIEAATIADVAKGMGEIVTEQLEKMGDVSLTGAQSIQVNQAAIKDLQEQIGEGLLPLMKEWYSFLLTGIKGIQRLMQTSEELAQGDGAKFFKSLNDGITSSEDVIAKYSYAIIGLKQDLKDLEKNAAWYQTGDAVKFTEEYKEIEQKITGLNDAYKDWVKTLTATKPVAQEVTEVIKEQGDAADKLRKQVEAALQTVKDLNDEFAAMSTGRTSALESRPNIDLDKLGLEDIERFSLDEPLDIDYTAFDALIEGQRMYNESLWLTQSLTTGIADAFAGAIVSGEDFGEAMKTILAETLKRLIAMVAQAALLSLIMSAIGGKTFSSAFSGIFGGLTGNSAGMDWNISGIVQGDIIRLAGAQASHNAGRK